jgi:hypothetical protein
MNVCELTDSPYRGNSASLPTTKKTPNDLTCSIQAGIRPCRKKVSGLRLEQRISTSQGYMQYVSEVDRSAAFPVAWPNGKICRNQQCLPVTSLVGKALLKGCEFESFNYCDMLSHTS